MDITGIIVEQSPLMQGVSSKGFQWAKQIFLLETNDTSRQSQDRVAFEVFGEDKLNAFALRTGDQVTVQLGFQAEIGTYQSRKDGSTCYAPRTTPYAWGIIRGGVPIRSQKIVAPQAPQAPVYQQPSAQQPPVPQPYAQQQVQAPAQQPPVQQGFGDPFAQTEFGKSPF